MSVAMSAPFAMLRRRSISSSVTSLPCSTSLSRSPWCISHTERMSGTSARTSSSRTECSARLDDAGDGARVGEVPGDLGGGAGLVDRHHDRAGVEQREVDERPLVGGARDEADLVAGLDAGGGESLREGDHLLLELRGGDVAPSGAVGDGEECELRGHFHPLHEQIGDVRLRIGGDDRRDFELDHGNSFGTGRFSDSGLRRVYPSGHVATGAWGCGRAARLQGAVARAPVGEEQRCSRSVSTSAGRRSPAASSTRTGHIVEKLRVDTPDDTRELADAVVDMARHFGAGHDIAAVGVAAAGFIDRDRATVIHAPNIAWRNEPLKATLESRIDVPVIIENDANAAGWAEFRFGAGRERRAHGDAHDGHRRRRCRRDRRRAVPRRPRHRRRARPHPVHPRRPARAGAGRTDASSSTRRDERFSAQANEIADGGGIGAGARRAARREGLDQRTGRLATGARGRPRRDRGAPASRDRARRGVRRIPGRARPRAVRHRRRSRPARRGAARPGAHRVRDVAARLRRPARSRRSRSPSSATTPD